MTDTTTQTQQPANTQETPLAPILFDKGYGALNAAYTQAIVQLVENLPKYSFERVFVTVKMGAVGSIYDIAKVMGAANSGNFYNVGKEVSSAIGGILFGTVGGTAGALLGGWGAPIGAALGATAGSDFGTYLWEGLLAPAIGVGPDGYPVPSGFSVEFKQLYGTDGTAVGLSIITKADSGLLSETRLDNGGLAVSQKTYTTSGAYTVLIDESSPAFSATTGTIGSVFSVDGQGNITAIHSENGYVTTDRYNTNGSVTSSSTGPNGTLTLETGPGQILLNAEAVITDPDTGLPATVDLTDSSSSAAPDAGISTLLNAINQYGGTLIDALSIIKAIQSGDPLPIAVSGLRLANDISNLADLPNYNLSGAASVGSSILSILSLEQALQRGDTLAAVTAGAQAISFGAQAYANFATGLDGGKAIQAAFGADSAISQLNQALPYLNLVNSIAHGDAIGVAVAVTDMVLMDAAVYSVPYIGWAYAAYSIISSLFGDEDPPPEPWGSAAAGWSGFGVVANAAGEHGGYEAAQGTMNQFIAQLNSLAAYEQSVNPGSAIGVIANRLPSLTYRNYTGFQLTDIDPITGVQRNPEIKYDLTGRPYNAPAGSEQASQSLSERFIRVALARGAVAPMWEVQTAAIQTQYGDPQAGLTEEERAGRNGLLAPSPQPSPAGGGGSQVFRAVALDLNGDGVQTTGANKTVAFDVDDSGFMKNTAWLSNNDGFLFLDRNLNGSIDSGRELFSNSIVDLSARGLAGMRWIDSNYDGRLTNADPVWNELKVWQDADGDGVADAGETQALSALGITALDYAMGRFEQNGQLKEMSSPDLAADTAGTRTHVVPEGIVVETTSGHTSLLVTRIDDRTVIEANRDGITSYEDIEAIVSTADLMANDMLGGFAGSNLSVTGVSNFRYGSGYLDANGFVHFTPEANYAGSEAGFDYTVLAGNDGEWRRAA